MAQEAGGCFKLHRVNWLKSYLSADGDRMLCWYQAPDAESVRIALRQLGSDMDAVWSGTTTGPGTTPAISSSLDEVNVLVELRLQEPSGGQDAGDLISQQAFPDADIALISCLRSTDGQRLVCLFTATDENTVKQALEEISLSAETLWACKALTPLIN